MCELKCKGEEPKEKEKYCRTTNMYLWENKFEVLSKLFILDENQLLCASKASSRHCEKFILGTY